MFIAIHAALQVFRPAVTILDSDDGIYAYRLYAYLVIFLVPILLASLAFAKGGYVSQGVFCAVPRSPTWPRLVLAWVPRFVVVLFLIGLTIAVYTHVARQLREFSASQRSSIPSMPGSVAGLPKISLPFPKRKQRFRDHLAGIDEEDSRRKSSAMFEPMMAVRMEVPPDPAHDNPPPFPPAPFPPTLNIPRYDQGPTTLVPITPGLVSPGAVSTSSSAAKGPDYFSLKPLAPILKVPQYSQGTGLPPITPGTDPLRRSPVKIRDFGQADYFNIKPALTRKGSSESLPVPTNALSPTPPWDRHGQLPQFMTNAPGSAYSTPSRQPTPPGGRAPGRRVSIDDSSQVIKALREERRDSLPSSEQQNAIRRNALQKSLRRLFVYPFIFVVFWIPPCVKSMLSMYTQRAEDDPLWLAALSTLCLTLMGAAYCMVFQWSERPWRHFAGRSRIWQVLRILLCLKKSRDSGEEDGYLESPSRERPPSDKAASLASNSTGTYTSHGQAPSQGVIKHLSKVQGPELAAGRRNSILGQHREHGGSNTSLATTNASRAKSISFAPMGQHLAGSSTTSLAKQLALERLNLELQDRKDHIHFQRRLSMYSGPSRMSSRTSVVTSLASIDEAARREWWDEEEEVEDEDADADAEGGRSDSDGEGELVE